METVKVTPWAHGREPDEAALQQCFAAEGLAAHQHSYHKVIYVVSGSITFGRPQLGQEAALQAGDRLDLPPGVVHTAVVGRDGVACLEGHRT